MPPGKNSPKTTTSGRKILSVHYGFAKYLLDQPSYFSHKQLETMLNAAHKNLLFTRNWQGDPWRFWIDGDIEREERVQLRTEIQASIPSGLMNYFSDFK